MAKKKTVIVKAAKKAKAYHKIKGFSFHVEAIKSMGKDVFIENYKGQGLKTDLDKAFDEIVSYSK
jgi:hypothetical protein